jgi:thioredoxin 2
LGLKLACLICGQGNRVPHEKLGAGPKCGTCGAPLLSGEPRELSFDILQKAARIDELPLIVDFWASWCGPCRMMAPEFAKAAGLLKGHARCAKLDTEAFPQAGQTYGIRGIPLLVAFRGGREIGRQAGARAAKDIEAWARTIGAEKRTEATR